MLLLVGWGRVNSQAAHLHTGQVGSVRQRISSNTSLQRVSQRRPLASWCPTLQRSTISPATRLSDALLRPYSPFFSACCTAWHMIRQKSHQARGNLPPPTARSRAEQRPPEHILNSIDSTTASIGCRTEATNPITKRKKPFGHATTNRRTGATWKKQVVMAMPLFQNRTHASEHFVGRDWKPP